MVSSIGAMRVAYFADLLYYRIAAGSVRYAGELANHLTRLPEVDLRPFSLYPQPVIERLARERGYPEAASTGRFLPRPLRLLAWHTTGWPAPAHSLLRDADLVHSPNLLVPPSRGCPLVVTVLDLSFLLFPQYHGHWSRSVIRLGLRRAIRDGAWFIAISENTADDLVTVARVPRDRVFVIPLAADSLFSPVAEPGSVLARLGVDSPYVLYVGTLEPRKNLGVLLQAFAGIGDPQVKLVLAGSRGWMFDDILAQIAALNLQARVVFTGYVPDQDLPALLSGAEAFVYPSIYEGFGLPVLEAMACGVPVITTNVSSLPEVAGEAALLVRPDDAVALGTALQRVLRDGDLREQLRSHGLARAARFSWTRTASETAAVYREVLV